MLAWNKEKFKGHSKKYRKIGGIHHRSENQQRNPAVSGEYSVRLIAAADGVCAARHRRGSRRVLGLKPLIGAAEVGWVCMLAAFPFAMCGFFTYNGMPAERFLLAVIRSEILCPRTLAYHPQNLYAELLLDSSTMREVLTLD